ncbi:MAG: cobalt ECF transporter T component CbiQ [Deltaproteobacteria bacterium]|nr:cobalt ECF transporter T component CbiQ [Deltaproteobacteria bacterium]
MGELVKKNPPTPLSALDSRIKLLFMAGWSVLLAVQNNQAAAYWGLGGSALIAALAGQIFRLAFWRKIFLVNVFLLFIWLAIPFSFSVPGETLWVAGGVAVTREGVSLALLLSVKALSITMGALALAAASDVLELLGGARALGVPEKVVSLMLLMTRYVAVVGHEFGRLRDAMRIRGFRARFSLHSLRSLANLCGALLVRGFERAERVYAAMLCRGYKGKFYFAKSSRLTRADLLFAVLALLLGARVLFANAS